MSLWSKELWDLKYRLVVLFVLLIGTGYFILSYYEYFLQFVDIMQIETALRHSFLARFLPPDLIIAQLEQIMSSIDLYVWSQWFGKNFYQLILLSTIVLGFSAFAKENENQTNSFLLSNMTRQNVYLTKILSGMSLLFILVLIGCFLPAILAPFNEYSFGIDLALKYLVQLATVSFFLYGIVIFFSIISNDVVWPIIGSIVVFALLSVFGRFELTQNLYIYRYLVGADIFFLGSLAIIPTLIILLLGLVLMFINWKIYLNKEF